MLNPRLRSAAAGALLGLAILPVFAAEDIWSPPTKIQRAATMWIIRVQSVPGDFLVPIAIMKAWHLKPGARVSIGRGRDIAQDVGGAAAYTPEIIAKLERLDRLDRINRLRTWMGKRRQKQAKR